MKSENCVNVSYGTPRFVIASFFSIWSLITQIASSIFVHKCFVAPIIASNICVGKVWLHKYWCFHQQENFNAFGSQLGSNENLTSPNWNLNTSIAMYRMSIFRSRLFPRNLWEQKGFIIKLTMVCLFVCVSKLQSLIVWSNPAVIKSPGVFQHTPIAASLCPESVIKGS